MFHMSEKRPAQIAEKTTMTNFIDTKQHVESFPKVILRQQENLQFPIKRDTQ